MSTKITIHHQFVPSILGLQLPFDSFICKEDPFEVLKKLIQEYNITSYKGVSSRIVTVSGAKIKVKNTENRYSENFQSYVKLNFGPRETINVWCHLSVEEFSDNKFPGLSVTGSVDDFDISFLEQREQPPYLANKDGHLAGLVRDNLVFVHTYNVPRANRLELSTQIVKSVDVYLKDRFNKKDDKLEQKLEAILEFASALHGREIDVSYLENLKVNIPEVGQPYYW